MIKTVDIKDIKPNTRNPRYIDEKEFKSLVESIKSFPEMLDARPIVVDKDLRILGGNMRWKASLEAGLGQVTIYIAGWDPEKDKEFIIKDNVSAGQWDWEMLANEWDADDLNDWGLEIPGIDDDPVESQEPEAEGRKVIILYFDEPSEWEQAQKRFGLSDYMKQNIKPKDVQGAVGHMMNGRDIIS